ncbi:hypothetical protein [Novipirellula sp.]|uniref:hypothetical protein n=1 Tax=Novipirellula sp. TaxID=2795430 RepID=UPI003565CFDF
MRYQSKLFVSGGLLAMSLALSGCRSGQGIFQVDRCADVPSGAIPAKPGSHLCEWQQAQVQSASIDQGVFYQADFVGSTDQLSPAAEVQVARLVEQGAVGTVSLIVEPSGDPHRDAGRVTMLASAFSAAGASIAAEQIQVAFPPALGLEGFRAQQVARQASRSGNQGGGQGQNGGGSISGSGLGGGGFF